MKTCPNCGHGLTLAEAQIEIDRLIKRERVRDHFAKIALESGRQFEKLTGVSLDIPVELQTAASLTSIVGMSANHEPPSELDRLRAEVLELRQQLREARGEDEGPYR